MNDFEEMVGAIRRVRAASVIARAIVRAAWLVGSVYLLVALNLDRPLVLWIAFVVCLVGFLVTAPSDIELKARRAKVDGGDDL